MNAPTYIDEATLQPVRLTPLEREPGTVQRYRASDGAIWMYRVATRSVVYVRKEA